MKIRSLIVEDILLAAKNLELLVKKFNTLEIIGISTNKEDAITKINFYNPDLIFMDIQLGGTSGFEILDICRGKYKYVCFTTAYNEYALNSYKYNSIHYILKPVTESSIKELLNKLDAYNTTEIGSKEIMQNPSPIQHEIGTPQKSNKYFFSENKTWKSIEITEIIYMVADRSYCSIKTIDKKYRISKNLMHMNLVVNDFEQFLRVHRSYIINIHYVKEMLKSKNIIIMVDGTKIPVSINEKFELYKKLGL